VGERIHGADLVDWELAAATAKRLAPRGPDTTPAEAQLMVAELRRLADESAGHVERITQLTPSGPLSPTVVVDRTGWAAANVAGLRWLTRPLFDALAEKRPPSRALLGVTRRVAGAQLGTLVALLSSRVLGQYEPFRADSPTGRLLLVAPNIAAAERALRVDSRDFRMWVCLHEQCHRAQFGAVPWLRGHLEGLVHRLALAIDLDPRELAERLRAAVASLRDPDVGLVAALQPPAVRSIVDELQALMTLLEGHADWAMDAAGEGVIGGLEEIRASFDARRKRSSGLIDLILRKVFGLDAKLAQYREGGAFVRAVVAASGVAGLNTVWESPAALPTREEIRDPHAWLRRVLGSSAPLPA
jgi:coenzyme F420 biosynthesis associated uncharacterized protein